ncbi:hypothetical protein BLNAU_21309 [Blattamonas nauphoetae]|uniref:Uncharacterized protein n=1 Tax=Blattamonas nauphoetae TaxID=2049346 RepID=A0ABQ9WW94_9EUKA|nr:hypothetical protein BLNAU_21309 [Blattamonas nauphoetae]
MLLSLLTILAAFLHADSIFVNCGSGGSDSETCGTSDEPCKTIKFGSDKISTLQEGERNLTLSPGFFDSSPIVHDTADYTLTVKGETRSQTIIYRNKNDDDIPITLKSGTLGLQQFSYVHTHSENVGAFLSVEQGTITVIFVTVSADPTGSLYEYPTSVVILTSGSVNFTQTSFTGFTLESQPLFSKAPAVSGYINSTVFHTIARNEGNGSVFELTLSDGKNWTIIDGAFSNCQCRNGAGGAIWAKVHPNTQLLVTGVYGTIFEGCQSAAEEKTTSKGGAVYVYAETGYCIFTFQNTRFRTNSAAYGTNVFIDVNILKNVAKLNTVFLCDFNQNDINGFVGHNAHKTDVYLPLAPYVRSHPLELSFAADGQDQEKCGYIDYPCKTFGYMKSRRWKRSTSLLTVNGESVIDQEIVVQEVPFKITNLDPLASVRLEDSEEKNQENGLITFKQQKLTFDGITLELGKSTHSSFIYGDGGDFKMDWCGLRQTDPSIPLELSFLKMINGATATLSRTVVVNTRFNLPAMVFEDVSVVSISGSVFRESISHDSSYIVMTSTVPVDSDDCMTCMIEDSILDYSTEHTLSNPEGAIVSFTQYAVIISDTQISTNLYPLDSYANGNVCGWSDSVIRLVRCDTFITYCDFQSSPLGGLSVVGGKLVIDDTQFSRMSGNDEVFPSAKKNIHCKAKADIQLKNVHFGSGAFQAKNVKVDTWIFDEDQTCSISGSNYNPKVPLFYPILYYSNSFHETAEDNSTVHLIELYGHNFYPCDMKAKITMFKEWTNQSTEDVVVSMEYEIGSFVYETMCDLRIPDTNLPSRNFTSSNITLLFGRVFEESTPAVKVPLIEVVEPTPDNKLSKAVKASFIILGTVCGLLCAAIVVLIIIMIIVIRKKNNAKYSYVGINE